MASADWWIFDGWAVAHHLDPLSLPLDRYLNLVYHWVLRKVEDQKEIDKFRRWLYLPIPGMEDACTQPEDSPWSAQAQDDSLADFANAVAGV